MLVDLAARARPQPHAPWASAVSRLDETALLDAPLDSIHPIDWLRLARRSPTLASCLRACVLVKRPACQYWPQVFLHRPDWTALVEQIQKHAGATDEDQRLQTAWLASALIRHSDTVLGDALYWQLLVADDNQSQHSKIGVGLQLSRALLAVARFENGQLPNPSFDAYRHDVALLDDALNTGTIDDLCGWRAEAQTAVRLHAWDWHGPLRDRLLAAAAVQIPKSLEWRFLALETLKNAESPNELANAAVAFLQTLCVDDVAVWAGPGSRGFGVVNVPWLGGRHRFVGSRGDFELSLPQTMRSSLRLDATESPTEIWAYFCNADDAAAATPELESIRRALDARVKALGKADKSKQAEPSIEPDEFLARQFADMVAEFAAGAGHEINNPLATIRGKAEWLLKLEPDPARRQALLKIQDQVARIRTMILDLRLVGVGSSDPFVELDWLPILEAALAVAAAAFPGVQLTLAPVGAGPRIRGNADLLKRMVVELVRNAAFAAGAGGQVEVRLTAGRDSEPTTIEIVDSGPGFPDSVRHKAFGPFFSGRSAGRGLGMGLCVARQIIALHNGHFVISPGRPTTVIASFP